MSKTYVFGIGGTGSRVFRALTFLLASGVECKNEIVPIIIDPDENNGDLTRTVTLMQQYKRIHNTLEYNDSLANNFFRTDIMEEIQNFILALDNVRDVTFEEFMEVKKMNLPNQAFMKMLFSDVNLQSNMQVGFKGNPNVGSIVLNQFAISDEFKEIANNFHEGDRIFIVSSIFGGTGASGFPLLLKTIRSNKQLPNFNLLNNSVIGAITVLPYFSVKPDNNSSIESDTFISKTKSALDYYAKNISGNNSVDYLYYIGDNTQANEAYDNSEGGSDQKNKAHFIEVASALSILDFVNNSGLQRNSRTQYKEFGVQADSHHSTLIFKNMGEKTIELMRNPFVQLFLLSSYLFAKDTKSNKMGQQWVKDLNFTNEFWKSDYMASLSSFCQYYIEWLQELDLNHIGFSPFTITDADLNKDPFQRVKGHEVSYSFFDRKRGYELFDKQLDHEVKNISNGENRERVFMDLFYKTTLDLIKDKLKL